LKAPEAQEFETFVREHSAKLNQFAGVLLGSSRWHEREDVVHEVLLRVFARHWAAKLVDWSEEDRLRYVRRAVVLEVRNLATRRFKREVLTAEDLVISINSDSDGVIDRISTLQLLLTLNQKARAVLWLRYVDDLSEAETAEVLGMRLGTVKSTTSRAISALRPHAERQRAEED
jgi:RNA polymerase sigma factor (sigma-70 family)